MINKPAKIRIIALAVLTCFLLVSVLSTAFISAHTDHEHDHGGANESCVTCVRIESAKKILKQLGTAMVVLSAAGSSYTLIGTIKAIFAYIFSSTPVALKMRMNN